MPPFLCQPTREPLDAVVVLPGSKSITNRALVCAALADGVSLLNHALIAEDTRLMIDALRALGVAVTVDERAAQIEITGCGGHLPQGEARLFCGNSGTTLRFCTALVALGQGRFELDGTPRMRQRPIGGLVELLRAQGTGVEYLNEEGFPPLVVHAAGLDGGRIGLQAPASSQWISALLLAAPYARRDLMLEVTGQIVSRPYLTLTTAMMDCFGAGVIEQYAGATPDRAARSSDRIMAQFIVPAPQRYQATTLTIEPDATHAGYFLAAAAIAGGRVAIDGLGTESRQGDVAFVDVLERMGCRVERAAECLTVIGPGVGALRGIDVDLSDMPDVVPTLAVTALFAAGPTVIRNVAHLRIKESDRLSALACELRKLGAEVDESLDGLTIRPPDDVAPATIDTYDDHRMAMSFALVGLRVAGVAINHPECCAKTFPDYFECLERMAGGRG